VKRRKASCIGRKISELLTAGSLSPREPTTDVSLDPSVVSDRGKCRFSYISPLLRRSAHAETTVIGFGEEESSADAGLSHRESSHAAHYVGQRTEALRGHEYTSWVIQEISMQAHSSVVLNRSSAETCRGPVGANDAWHSAAWHPSPPAPALEPGDLRVLIVNEDMASAESLRRTLRDLGYFTTYIAYSAATGDRTCGRIGTGDRPARSRFA
jgi:hypothetical protein